MTVSMGQKAASLLVLVWALAATPSALAYGWPLKPFHRAHPIRANFGDPRTIFSDPFEPDGPYGDGAFAFHNGLDISANPGQAVYPVASGVARVSDLAAVKVRSSRGRVFKYVHITPDVYDGQRVKARRTVLGHVDGVARHVHFTEIDRGVVVNPIGVHHLRPYRDRTTPWVGAVHFETQGSKEFKAHGVVGTIVIVAEAYDMPALPVPGSWLGYPVSPAVVRWSLTSSSGRSIVPRKTVADFRKTAPRNQRFWRIYARGTYENKPRFGSQQLRTLHGRYEFRLTRTPLDTRKLADGAYAVKVIVKDTAGNRSARTETMTVCNADPSSCATPSP